MKNTSWIDLLPWIIALIAAIISYLNRKETVQLHQQINSRMTELLDVTRKAAKAEGKEAQRQDAELTEQLTQKEDK